MFSILVLPSPQLATNAPLPPSHIQQPVPRLLNNIREHCRVCNLPYEPNRGLTSSNQHTQWCHHFCPHLGTSCGTLLLLLAIRSRSCCLVFRFIVLQETGLCVAPGVYCVSKLANNTLQYFTLPQVFTTNLTLTNTEVS